MASLLEILFAVALCLMPIAIIGYEIHYINEGVRVYNRILEQPHAR